MRPLAVSRADEPEGGGEHGENQALHEKAPFVEWLDGQDSSVTAAHSTRRKPNEVSGCPSPSKSYLMATMPWIATPANASP